MNEGLMAGNVSKGETYREKMIAEWEGNVANKLEGWDGDRLQEEIARLDREEEHARRKREEKEAKKKRRAEEKEATRKREAELDSQACWKCGEVDRRSDIDLILLCSTEGCSGASHVKCNDPPLSGVPEGDWFCSGCRNTDNGGEGEESALGIMDGEQGGEEAAANARKEEAMATDAPEADARARVLAPADAEKRKKASAKAKKKEARATAEREATARAREARAAEAREREEAEAEAMTQPVHDRPCLKCNLNDRPLEQLLCDTPLGDGRTYDNACHITCDGLRSRPAGNLSVLC